MGQALFVTIVVVTKLSGISSIFRRLLTTRFNCLLSGEGPIGKQLAITIAPFISCSLFVSGKLAKQLLGLSEEAKHIAAINTAIVDATYQRAYCWQRIASGK